MEQWSVVFRTIEDLAAMIGAIATLVALLLKRHRNDTDDQDRRR